MYLVIQTINVAVLNQLQALDVHVSVNDRFIKLVAGLALYPLDLPQVKNVHIVIVAEDEKLVILRAHRRMHFAEKVRVPHLRQKVLLNLLGSHFTVL